MNTDLHRFAPLLQSRNSLQRVRCRVADIRVGVLKAEKKSVSDCIIIFFFVAFKITSQLCPVRIIRVGQKGNLRFCSGASQPGKGHHCTHCRIRAARVYHHVGKMRSDGSGVCAKQGEGRKCAESTFLVSINIPSVFFTEAYFFRERPDHRMTALMGVSWPKTRPFDEQWESVCSDAAQSVGGGTLFRLFERLLLLRVSGHPLGQRAAIVTRFGVAVCQGNGGNDCHNRECYNGNFPPAFHAYRVGRCFE